MVRKRNARTLALAGWAVWACALPTNNAPNPVDGGTTGGSSQGGDSGSGGTATGGASGSSMGGTAMTGGSSTGGSTMTGGSSTGGTVGGAGASTGGTGGATTGGTGSGAGGKGGTAGAGGATGGTGGAGAGAGGKGGTAGSASGAGGSLGGAGTGGGGAGKGGTAGTGGSGGSAICPCIVHRYAFSGTGTQATDSVGTAHGTIMGGTQTGGAVTLTGGTSDQYVSLPSGIVSSLTNATFEAWVSWTGGTANWQRIFDFGANDGAGANGQQGTTNAASPYLFLTPRAGATTASANCMQATASLPRVAFTTAGPSMEACTFGTAAFPTGQGQVAVTISGTQMSLYIRGAPVGTAVTLPSGLSGIADTNNWLGRSQYYADTEFAGTIYEFRIYNTARSASQIAASNTAGPDTPPTQ